MMNYPVVIISTVMLRSAIFSKVTASVGILANVIILAYYIGLAFVSIPLAIGVILFSASGLLSLLWFILIGRRLLMLAQSDPET
jgi:hypothetical protein